MKTSIIEQIATDVFALANLDEAKQCAIKHISTAEINIYDRDKMIKEIENQSTLTGFQRYMANALLKFEGLGTNGSGKTKRIMAHPKNQFRG